MGGQGYSVRLVMSAVSILRTEFRSGCGVRLVMSAMSMALKS